MAIGTGTTILMNENAEGYYYNMITPLANTSYNCTTLLAGGFAIIKSKSTTTEPNLANGDGGNIDKIAGSKWVVNVDMYIYVYSLDGVNLFYYWTDDNTSFQSPEGTAIKSTGEIGGTKVLTEDGLGGATWEEPQAPAGGGGEVFYSEFKVDCGTFSYWVGPQLNAYQNKQWKSTINVVATASAVGIDDSNLSTYVHPIYVAHKDMVITKASFTFGQGNSPLLGVSLIKISYPNGIVGETGSTKTVIGERLRVGFVYMAPPELVDNYYELPITNSALNDGEYLYLFFAWYTDTAIDYGCSLKIEFE